MDPNLIGGLSHQSKSPNYDQEGSRHQKAQQARPHLPYLTPLGRLWFPNYALTCMIMAIRIVQVDAFTNKPFAGNPAAVVVLREEPEEHWMRNVAREMNLSETAYL